ncbi:hypothetical protein G210_3609, partial [Candida maltosa Xu316]
MANLVDDENDDTQDTDREIQFHSEDYYYGSPNHADTFVDNVSVNVEDHEASLSNVWAALDDFDSFFTKEAEQN